MKKYLEQPRNKSLPLSTTLRNTLHLAIVFPLTLMVTWLHHQFLTWPVYLLFKEMIALRGSLVSWKKRRLNLLAYKLTLLLDQGKLVLLRSIITIYESK